MTLPTRPWHLELDDTAVSPELRHGEMPRASGALPILGHFCMDWYAIVQSGMPGPALDLC